MPTTPVHKDRQLFLNLSITGVMAVLLGSYLNHALPVDLLTLPNCMTIRFGHIGALISLGTGIAAVQAYRYLPRCERHSYDIAIWLTVSFFFFISLFTWYITFIVSQCA